MPTFPQWMFALGIIAGGVWAVSQWNMQAAWFLAIIVLLSIALFRDPMLGQLNTLLKTVFGSASQAPTRTGQLA